MFVRGVRATDPSSVEVWLDACTPNCQRIDEDEYRRDGRRTGVPIGYASYMKMRAEAARYREDAEAEAMWNARAATLTARQSDPTRSILASIAGM